MKNYTCRKIQQRLIRYMSGFKNQNNSLMQYELAQLSWHPNCSTFQWKCSEMQRRDTNAENNSISNAQI